MKKTSSKRRKIINVLDFYEHRMGSPSSIDDSLKNHSELAMAAAKKMRKSRCKEKTGHLVCTHLLEMLSDNNDFNKTATTEISDTFEETGFWLGSSFIKSGDGRQFSLSL